MTLTNFLPLMLLASVIAVLFQPITTAASTIPSKEEQEFPDKHNADNPVREDKPQNDSQLNGLTKINGGEQSKYEVFVVDALPPIKNSTVLERSEQDKFLCESESMIIYPQAAMTRDGNYVLVANNLQYKQGVKVEVCKHAGLNCNWMDSLPRGYKSFCKQNYSFRELITISQNGTTTKDTFRMPSCCQCVIQRL